MCDTLISWVIYLFIFYYVEVCRDRIPLLCSRASVVLACLVMCAPRPCRYAPNALSLALCLTMTSLPHAQCPFPVVTKMNFVVTWDLLTMTELCRDLKFLCRNLVSTAYTSLCRDTEKSCRNIKLLVASVLCLNTKKLYSDTDSALIVILYCDTEIYVMTINPYSSS